MMAQTLSRSIKLGFSAAGISLSTAGLLLNILGAYALISTRPRGNKQTYLLVNISIISVCLCTLFIPSWTLWGIVNNKSYSRVEEVLFITQTGFYMAYVTSTFGLTIDRFLAVAKPFKHSSIVTYRFVKGWILGCWLWAHLSRIPFLFVSSNDLTKMVYFDVSVNALNVLFQPVTYVYILIIWKRQRNQLHTDATTASPASIRTKSARSRDAKREASMLKIAVMVSACCLVSSICDFLYVALGISTPSSKETVLSPISLLLWNMVAAVQSLFYIITKSEIRQLIVRTLCICKN